MLEGSSKQQRAALLAMSELGGDNGREVMIRFAKLNGGEGAADIFRTWLAELTTRSSVTTFGKCTLKLSATPTL